ncbi:MAG: DNA-3-methyladenine glycosylase 2 family protein [Deltaproteobacteria bacterium]|nr:DNA-3-methyladenine glycosylase 2 family protein [Nannocystaceae bacterium]
MAEGTRIKLPRNALAKLVAGDPELGAVITRVPFAMTHGSSDNHLAALVRSIVFQQLSGKAATTIYNRFRALFVAEQFPSAETILAMHHRRIRGAGISKQKQAAIRDLCKHVRDGRLPLDDLAPLPDDELTARIVAVRGLGVWSAQMFMMFHLGRLDVWPVDDLGIRKGMAKIRGLAELPGRKQMLAMGERYKPYRSIAAWYLWRATELPAENRQG